MMPQNISELQVNKSDLQPGVRVAARRAHTESQMRSAPERALQAFLKPTGIALSFVVALWPGDLMGEITITSCVSLTCNLQGHRVSRTCLRTHELGRFHWIW